MDYNHTMHIRHTYNKCAYSLCRVRHIQFHLFSVQS